MRRSTLAGALLLCMSSRVQAQRETPQPRVVLRGIASEATADTARTAAIEQIEVLRHAAPLDRMTAPLRRSLLDTLEAKKRLWAERRPRQYLIRTFELSGCADVRTGPYAGRELLRDRLVIRDSVVLRSEPAPTPAAYAQRCQIPWRVEDLFADVARILSDPSAAIARLEYDAAYGFPRSYWPDRGGLDRGRGVLVESFAPAP